jgi:hypothetical protein
MIMKQETLIMSKKKPFQRKRQAYWQKVIKQWQKSGLSVRAFCRQQSISETSFYQRRRRLAGSAPSSPRQEPKDQFVEVNLPSLSTFPTSLEIIWAKPPVVKVHAGCDHELLREALVLLAEQTC